MTLWALSGCAVILAVLTLRALLGQWLSSRARYALWLLVLARLLIFAQFPIAAPVTLAGLLPEALPVSQDPFPPLPDPAPAIPGGSASEPHLELAPPAAAEDITVTVSPALTPGRAATCLWAAGAMVSGGVLLAFNLRFARDLRRRRRPEEAPDCPLKVYRAEGLTSPCLFGLFRPAIYLTPEAAALGPREREHILAHELTHYAHGDHIWSLLRCLCLALHWYNPLVWLAAALSKRDGELSCDEGAVARLGEKERVPYGRTLVGLSIRPTRPADLLECSTAMTGGKKALRERVAALVRKPETKKTALFAAAALLALAAVFVFAGRGPVITYEEFCRLAQSDSHTQVHVPSEDGAVCVLYKMGGNPNLRALLCSGTASSGTCSAPDKLPYAPTILFTDVSDGFYDTYDMVETGSGCELLASRQGEKDLLYYRRRIAVFPAGTAEKIAALAREQGTEGFPFSDMERFLARAEAARTLRVGEPLYSSFHSPDIVDEDLVEEARAILRRVERSPDAGAWAGADFPNIWMESRGLILDGTYRYALYDKDGTCYVLEPRTPKRDSYIADDYYIVGTLPQGMTAEALGSLGRRQYKRMSLQWQTEKLYEALDMPAYVRFTGPFVLETHGDEGLPEITDPDLLERAVEALRGGELQDGSSVREMGQDYWGAVTVRTTAGWQVFSYNVTNLEMCRTLYGLALEQAARSGTE